MPYSIGDKVRLRFTGETGLVTKLLGDQMVLVRLDSDPTDQIPTFEEDLVALGEYNRFATAPPAPAGPKGKRVLSTPSTGAGSRGLQLIFEPMPGRDESISLYKTWLWNDTPYSFLFELKLFVGDDKLMELEGKAEPSKIYESGDLPADALSDVPEAEISLRRITTAGTDEEVFKIIKIKTKQFFKNTEFIPALNIPAHYFVVADNFEKSSENETQDLAAYTRQKLAEEQQKKVVAASNLKKVELFNPEAVATFETEIDLHANVLLPGYHKIDKKEILRLQMQHFERFMERAHRLGISNVFIIHGLGEGKLKAAVAERLRELYFVRNFKNEYHHKYGYGATEVWIG